MPTVAEVLRTGRPKPPAGLPPLQRKLLEYLDANPDEVFAYEHAAELSVKLGATGADVVKWNLLSLDSKGLIAKTKMGRKVYFGSRLAINQLTLAGIVMRDNSATGQSSLSPVPAIDRIG